MGLICLFAVLLLLAGCRFYIHIDTYGSITGFLYQSIFDPTDIVVMPYDDPPAGYRPLGGVRVDLCDEYGRLEDSTQSRYSDGRFTFYNVTPGNKVLVFRYQYQQFSVKLIVSKGKYEYLVTSKPKVHYVIIGIDEYPYMIDPETHQKVKNMDVSVRDAKAFKSVFVDNNRMSGTYQFLTNQNATKNNIRKAIQNAAWVAGPNDYLVVYFSGYADWEIWAGGVTKPLDHIVPYDGKNYGDINQAVNSVITDGELESWISSFPNNNVTVILDVAYAATFIDGVVREQSADEFELLALKNKGYTVLAAARSDERTKVSPKVGSLFTLSLIKGINEIPDSYITAYQLFEYARYQMQVVERVTDQNPVFEGPQNRVIYIRKSYYW